MEILTIALVLLLDYSTAPATFYPRCDNFTCSGSRTTWVVDAVSGGYSGGRGGGMTFEPGNGAYMRLCWVRLRRRAV